jgi:hypothetical protein
MIIRVMMTRVITMMTDNNKDNDECIRNRMGVGTTSMTVYFISNLLIRVLDELDIVLLLSSELLLLPEIRVNVAVVDESFVWLFLS